MKIDPFNPLDIAALGESLLRHLERQPVVGLPEVAKFEGSGIYALYYAGAATMYKKTGSYNSKVDCRIPIYVGRAKAKGARAGGNLSEGLNAKSLWSRLAGHKRSIENAKNLEVADFRIRVLVVTPIWTPLAEVMMIDRYRPIWNSVLSGFGNNAPGGGRGQQAKSDWDVVHPGRGHSMALTGKKKQTLEALLAKVAKADADSAAAVRRLSKADPG